MADLAYWIFNYMLKWEAASKEARILFDYFSGTHRVNLISLNTRDRRIRIRDPEKYLPLPYSLLGLPLLYYAAGRHRVNHLFSSPGEWVLMPRISRLRSILTVCKEADSVDAFERNRDYLRRFRYIVVESPRHKDILAQIGINGERVKLIYPPMHIRPYEPAQGRFTVLFASSPFAKNKLLSRGVLLMLSVAKRLPQVRFVLAWRGHNHDALSGWIKRMDVGNVTVVDGDADMPSLYDAAHVTILPGLDYASLKPCPHSALESLAHGKPVLASSTTSLADIISGHNCGIVFDANVVELENAIGEAMNRYNELQKNCHRVVETFFSREIFLQKYERLYDDLLNERAA